MRDNEIVGLWEAYLQVHQPKEEVEQLDESGLSQDTIRRAVKERQRRVDAAYREDTPEGDERGDKGMEKLKRSKGQLYINKRREVRMRANEEVEQLDEFVPGLQKPVNNILKKGQEKLKQFGFKVNENPRPTINQQKQYQNINHKPVKEEVENWVNSLIEEGYDLSEYTWDDMYEMYVTEGPNYDKNRQRAAQRAAARNAARKEGKTGNVPGLGYVSPRPERETYRDSAGVERHTSGAKMPKKEVKEDYSDAYEMYVTEADSIAAMRARAAKRRKQRYGASDTSRGGRDDFAPITDYEAANKKWERPTQKENVDLFDAILEHLVAEGYADTNESALVIMANMSEEWRESIVEAEEKEDKDKNQSKTGLRGDETKKKPKGWRPTGPKLRYGERPGYMR